MALTFGSGDYLHYFQSAISEKALATAAPFSVSIWFKTAGQGSAACLWSMADKDVGNHLWRLVLRSTATRQVRMGVFAGSGTNITTTATYALNTWQHAGIVEASPTSHSVFVNGVNKVTKTTSRVPLNADRTCLGRVCDSTPGQQFNGDQAHFSMWNVALSDQEMASLGAGLNPLYLRGGSGLICYSPLNGLPDTINVAAASEVWKDQGSVALAIEPPLFQPIVAP
jgi:hypothetical protein